MSNLARISVSLETDLLRRFDEDSARQGYPTRSEALKALMRRSFVENDWAANAVVAGAVTLVYDHHRRGLVDRLMDIQHDFSSLIVSTQHVHLDHDRCLEVVVVKGRAALIRDLVAALKSVKGLKHNALVMTSTGEGRRRSRK
jgi:CopG family transcriptional regulator, nickel-responsive regulator